MAWNSNKVKVTKPVQGSPGVISSGASSHTAYPGYPGVNPNISIPAATTNPNVFTQPQMSFPIGSEEVDALAKELGVGPATSSASGTAVYGKSGVAYSIIDLFIAMKKLIVTTNLKLCGGCDEVRPMNQDDYKCDRCRSEGI